MFEWIGLSRKSHGVSGQSDHLFSIFLHGPLVLSILARFDQLELHLDASLIENDDVQIFSAAGRTVLAALAKLLGTVGLVITRYVILVGPFINIYLKLYKK